MKIGITYSTRRGAQTLLALAQIFETDHALLLVNRTPELGSWWPNVVDDHVKITAQELLESPELLDLLVDIDGQASVALRARAKRTVALFRGDPSFRFLEEIALPTASPAPYSLKGVEEVWVWDALVPSERLGLLRALFEDLPVRRVPYVWTPVGLQDRPLLQNDGTVHIVETNRSNTSSCILPLLGCAKVESVHHIRICHGQGVAKDKFFQENVRKNVHTTATITYQEELDSSCSTVVAHTRFVAFREELLNLAWLGIPLVHNCVTLRTIGHGLEATYYPENDVDALASALRQLPALRWNEQGASRRAALEDRWSVERGRIGWREVLGTPLVRAAPPLLVPTAPSSSSTVVRPPSFIIGFCDMWEGFDPTDNFFLDLLRDTLPSLPCEGEAYEEGGTVPKLLLFGPFGSQWRTAPKQVPKVFFSGERVDPATLQDPSISLYLTHDVREDDRHIRCPLWLTYLHWFSSTAPVRNPVGLPLQYATDPVRGERDSFCAFVVSNPTCQERNDAFEALHRYKPVSSGGAYKNNIGGPIASLYAGGGAGDVAKFEFLKRHTFNLCYENSVAPGYVTEKLLHAKLAGCVTLYRGAPEAVADFDPSGFILCNDLTPDQVVETVQSLERDPVALQAMAQTPALSPAAVQAGRALLRTIGQALLRLAFPTKRPTLCSFATQDFHTSLVLSLQSIEQLQQTVGPMRYIAYLGQDIQDKDADALRKRFPFLETRRLPSTSPVAGFDDFFTPFMYGWKLWILKTLCAELEGLVLYTDAGASWVSLPGEMLRIADKDGVCVLTDTEHTNRGYCSKEMVQAMAVTEKELDQRQLMAGFVAFRAKSEAATQLFDEVFRWASKRECLFGIKEGANQHRHDQSLLSVISLRQASPTLDGKRVVCFQSLRKTYQKAASVYCHRGAPRTHGQVLKGIDDIWVVNLDRRADRWASWLAANPSLKDDANRLPAIDGKTLTLTPALAAFFDGNDFLWKKSVVGCALSHAILWAQLVCEHPAVKNYMIFEDDHRFVDQEGWPETWKKAVQEAPADAELLYLGGVLPGNKSVYSDFLEPVNDVWATIRPNTAFGSNTPLPIFHFCTYAYVLTRAGAAKLLKALQTTGCYTSIDHFLNHPRNGLRVYVMRDLIAKCFQDDDPVYQQSQFDDFKRVDAFDSDIWNNKECFSERPISTVVPPLWNTLLDVFKQAPHSIQTRTTLHEKEIRAACTQLVYYYDTGSETHDGQMEGEWLKTVCASLVFQPFTTSAAFVPNSWLLVSRSYMEEWLTVTRDLDEKGIAFRVLHLSDEGLLDPLEPYSLKCCTKVVRNYIRPTKRPVFTLPLGFATPPIGTMRIPSHMDRDLVWSFHGTAWFDRPALLKPLEAVTPHSLHWTPGWKHATATPPEAWQAILLRTQFVPVPRGNHAETFRLYEALEHGCIPLYVRVAGDDLYWAWLRHNLTLMEIKEWAHVPQVIAMFQKNPGQAELYRTGILDQWAQWKRACRMEFV